MRLSFEIPATRINEVFDCLNQESSLDTRINSFEIVKLDNCYKTEKEMFTVSLSSDNEFFIQRMAEAAREKTDEERGLAKHGKIEIEGVACCSQTDEHMKIVEEISRQLEEAGFGRIIGPFAAGTVVCRNVDFSRCSSGDVSNEAGKNTN